MLVIADVLSHNALFITPCFKYFLVNKVQTVKPATKLNVAVNTIKVIICSIFLLQLLLKLIENLSQPTLNE